MGALVCGLGANEPIGNATGYSGCFRPVVAYMVD